MSFVNGFLKTAGFREGMVAAGNETIKDALKLKGLRNAVSEIQHSHPGKMKELLSTPEGRKALYKATAKSLPSAAAATAYGYIGKKIYNRYYKKDPHAEAADYYYR